ncbi:MAG: glycosyltransferase family 4 protein [Pseudomonadota bacterium]
MKRVCIVCDGIWEQLQGGAEYQLSLLADGLAARGYEVHYVYVNRGMEVRRSEIQLHALDVSSLVRRVFYPYQWLLWPQLSSRLRAIRPDVVINRVGNAITGICAHYAKTTDTPMIWHVANITDLQRFRPPRGRTLPFSFLNKKLLEYGVRNATAIVTQARYQSSMLEDRFARHANAVIPNFHPGVEEALTSDRPYVLWVANVKPRKQPEYFIRMVEMIGSTSDARFLLVGRAEHPRYEAEIQSRIKPIANLEWCGELPIGHVNQLLAKSQVFVNTSRFEGFPNTFIQAWQREVPVVSLEFDPDGVLEQEGIGFHSRNLTRLCEDVLKLLKDPAQRQDIGRRASDYAAHHHGLKPNIDRYAQLIESLVKP